MARISGVDLPREKRVEIGLTYIFGIGVKTSQEILAATGVNPDTRVKDLTEQDVNKIREYIEHNLKVEGAGFGTDTNVVTLITRDSETELPIMTKEEVADCLLTEILKRTKEQDGIQG